MAIHSNTAQQLSSILTSRPIRSIVIFSGAGMSQESGIPTFRSGDNSLWSQFDSQDLATPSAWRNDRSLVWGWYAWRRALIHEAQPHPGYDAIRTLQRLIPTTVVTQNVDDLHERAGIENILHLHGEIMRTPCDRCGVEEDLPVTPFAQAQRVEPHRCAHCSGYLRPGVVWFGEALDARVVAKAQKAIQACELLVIVGTSGLVQPAASLVDLAEPFTPILEINPIPSRMSSIAQLQLNCTASEGLRFLADEFQRLHEGQ